MSYLLQQQNRKGLVIESIPFTTRQFAEVALKSLEMILIVANLDASYTYSIVEAEAAEEKTVA